MKNPKRLIRGIATPLKIQELRFEYHANFTVDLEKLFQICQESGMQVAIEETFLKIRFIINPETGNECEHEIKCFGQGRWTICRQTIVFIWKTGNILINTSTSKCIRNLYQRVSRLLEQHYFELVNN